MIISFFDELCDDARVTLSQWARSSSWLVDDARPDDAMMQAGRRAAQYLGRRKQKPRGDGAVRGDFLRISRFTPAPDAGKSKGRLACYIRDAAAIMLDSALPPPCFDIMRHV